MGETIGILFIPKLNAELPIVEGTDENQLKKGVGHYKNSTLPNEQDQIVLSGHRDTVFRRVGKLEKGDVLIIKLQYGTFRYKIFKFQIIKANDRTIIHSIAPGKFSH
ncbi:hypothetical protein BpJC4_30260 [Weizmannia acidilactici]|nr:hypothetical protein BpJC4_30260 [Weizmannia acidilactici]GER75040.1 hypothetical protein BpPP18_31070 [Weizmannia acidilactici]